MLCCPQKKTMGSQALPQFLLALVGLAAVAAIVFSVSKLLGGPTSKRDTPLHPGTVCEDKFLCDPKDADPNSGQCCFTKAACRLQNDGRYTCCEKGQWNPLRQSCCDLGELYFPGSKGCQLPCGPSPKPCDASQDEKREMSGRRPSLSIRLANDATGTKTKDGASRDDMPFSTSRSLVVALAIVGVFSKW